MKYFIANWKMNMDLGDINTWIKTFTHSPLFTNMEALNNIEVILCPSNAHILFIKHVADIFHLKTGIQDISQYDKGAHTGETGAFQMKDLAEYCILGHSERKETSDIVEIKRGLCLKYGIKPITCFRNIEDLSGLSQENSILAWEDPNNISQDGKYREKDSGEIEEGIKEIIKNTPPTAEILYGGSVNRDNVKKINNINGIKGILIGNASLDPNHFADIIISCI